MDVIGFMVDNGSICTLVDILSVNLILSKILSAELATISNFLINDLWILVVTTQIRGSGVFLRSNAIRFLGVFIAPVILKILYGGFGVNLMVANSIGIFLGFVSNYVLESIYTWKTHEKME